jgi:hypothetical protein
MQMYMVQLALQFVYLFILKYHNTKTNYTVMKFIILIINYEKTFPVSLSISKN